jgi:siroheme synthase (precorrin-2 oxidase/ferrochelatase)
MDQIVEIYGQGRWLQTGKDILDPDSLPEPREISVSSNMLGYFQGDTQKMAINNILSKTNSEAYLAASGQLGKLDYRWNELIGWKVEKEEERRVFLRRKRSFLSKISFRRK